MANEVINNIPCRLQNIAVNGHVAGTSDIIDDELGKSQAQINTEVNATIIEVKEKEYNAQTFSGLGRKYLPKNIISNVNMLTQAMLSDANTIYIIQYDYDLNDASITIPANCVLKFDGGSFSNGTLNGNNTKVEYRTTIFDDISIGGTWIVPELHSFMFADIEDDNLHNLLAMQNPNIFNHIYLNGSEEYSVKPYNLTGIRVGSNTDIEINVDVRLVVDDNSQISFILQTYVGEGSIAENINIHGSGTLYGNFTPDMVGYNESSGGLRVFMAKNVRVAGLTIKDTQGDGCGISKGCEDVIFENITVSNFARNGFSVIGCPQVKILNCKAENGGYTDPYAAIDIEPNPSDESYQYKLVNVSIENFIATNCARGICSYCPPSSIIEKVCFKNSTFTDCGKALTDIITQSAFAGDMFWMTMKDTSVVFENMIVTGGVGALGRIQNAKGVSFMNAQISCENMSGISFNNSTNIEISNSTFKAGQNVFLAAMKNAKITNCVLECTQNIFQTNNSDVDYYTRRIIIENSHLKGRIGGVFDGLIVQNCIIEVSTASDQYNFIIGFGTLTNVDFPPIFRNNVIKYTGSTSLLYAVQGGINGSIFSHNVFNLPNVTRGINLVSGVEQFEISDNVFTGCTYRTWDLSSSIRGRYTFLKSSTRPTFVSQDVQNIGFCMWDKTINKPIWYTGSGWVDATGATV